ncbi:hypothetical protein C2E23DRAFT_591751 [Lenzites betulinus]|nr:hypothetical protein C2E23DRAFT_591751 [Lenzites betulinus]
MILHDINVQGLQHNREILPPQCSSTRIEHELCDPCRPNENCPVTPSSPPRVTIESAQYRPLRHRLLEHPVDLIEMVSQVADTLHVLHYDHSILHRDVSPTNILWEPEQGGGGARFVLHDLDHPIDMDEHGNAVETETKTEERAGAVAFMAIELLEDMHNTPVESQRVKHALYHDYESLFWVALWSTMNTERDVPPDIQAKIRSAVAQWETRGYDLLAASKSILLFGLTRGLARLPLTPGFRPLLRFLCGFLGVFRSAYYASGDESEDAEAEGREARSAEEVKHAWIHRDKIRAAVEAYRVAAPS